MGKTYFISGIDTDCGKTYITSQLSRILYKKNISIITQKLVQTGCTRISEDIIEHRKAMGCELLPDDIDGTTCPYLFSFASSPHYAAEKEGILIDIDKIYKSTQQLESKYDIVLLEGAGGLCVPLTKDLLTIDYVANKKYPLIFVTTSKLGSINHTLLSLELCIQKNIQVHCVIYNELPNANAEISKSSLEYIGKYIDENFTQTQYLTNSNLNRIVL